MPPDDPLHAKDIVIIAALIVVGALAFGAVVSALGRAKLNFVAPPAITRN